MARMDKLNVRQRKFVLGLFEGKSATQSYIDAGYKPSQGNSSRLKWYDTIQAELAKLQAEARKSSEVSFQSLMLELENARERATSLNQLSAAVKATSEKIKLSGLAVQKVEVSSQDYSLFDKATSIEQILTAVASERGPKCAWHVAMACGVTPADYGIAIEGEVIWGSQRVIEGKDLQTRHAGLASKTFKPPAPSLPPPQVGQSQYASEQSKPINRRREIG